MKSEVSIPESKSKVVKELMSLMDEYPIVGTVNMENMPTAQLQAMRENLREKVVIRMTKKRLIKIVLNEAKKKGVKDLEPYLRGMPALIFTKDNPFSLFKILQKNKSSTPAKAGQTSPKDVWVKAGLTPFAPGPIIGELGALGIKAGVEGPKVAIKEDKCVIKEGEVFSKELTSLLTRLKVEPMEIGLDLTAILEEGTIFTKNVLDVDEDQIKTNFETAARWSMNLAMEAGFPTTATLPLLIGKAFNESKALALEADILTDATAVDVLAKAESQAKSLNSQLDIKPVEEKKSEPVKEPKAEEKEETKGQDPKVE